MANHGWTWVRSPALRPNRCAVFPHVSVSAWIDTGTDINSVDPHVYISDVAAKELGKMVGLVPQTLVDQARADHKAAQERIEYLEAENEELRTYKEAVEIVVKAAA